MTEIDSEDDTSVTFAILTSDSHMCTKSCGDFRHIPSLETPTIHDHSKMSVDHPNDNFEVNNCTHLTISYIYIISVQVTCHPVHGTDNAEDYSDNVDLLTFKSYRSSSAYCNNEVTEIFELLGT